MDDSKVISVPEEVIWRFVRFKICVDKGIQDHIESLVATTFGREKREMIGQTTAFLNSMDADAYFLFFVQRPEGRRRAQEEALYFASEIQKRAAPGERVVVKRYPGGEIPVNERALWDVVKCNLYLDGKARDVAKKVKESLLRLGSGQVGSYVDRLDVEEFYSVLMLGLDERVKKGEQQLVDQQIIEILMNQEEQKVRRDIERLYALREQGNSEKRRLRFVKPANGNNETNDARWSAVYGLIRRQLIGHNPHIGSISDSVLRSRVEQSGRKRIFSLLYHVFDDLGKDHREEWEKAIWRDVLGVPVPETRETRGEWGGKNR